jgi:hypothetical protein
VGMLATRRRKVRLVMRLTPERREGDMWALEGRSRVEEGRAWEGKERDVRQQGGS